jgi:MarR-like DNA-binding transcriptional regulator SgrR of sgrS sRNA
MRETENTTALLTIREIATILQCSKTHAAKLLGFGN